MPINNIEINDVLVQRVLNIELQTLNSGYKITVNVPELNSGIYFVKAKGEKGERVIKFVKA